MINQKLKSKIKNDFNLINFNINHNLFCIELEDLEDLDEAELLERAKELSLQENPLISENKEKPKGNSN